MTRVFRWIGKLVLVVLTLFVTFVVAITILRPDDPTVEMLANSESAQREAYGRQMRELLYAGQYDSLEHVADRLRRERLRWDTGDWKLRTFYVLGFRLKESGSSEDQWVLLDEHLRRWIAARPMSITARIALTNSLVGHAWHARGAGVSRTVSDSGRQLFGERLAEARAVLIEARALPVSCPGWWAAAQQVALGEGWDRQVYDSLFQDAVTREPTYFAYYELRALHLLRRWYGEDGEWQRDARASADAHPGVVGDEIYARIVWSQEDLGLDDYFADSSASWARTRRGFEHMLRAHPGSLEIRSKFARLAVRAGDRQEARRHFAELGGRVDPAVWDDTWSYRVARKWAFKDD